MLLPVLFCFPLGFSLKYLEMRLEEDPQPLPEWDDWGAMFRKGAGLSLLLIAYAGLPLALFLLAVILLFEAGKVWQHGGSWEWLILSVAGGSFAGIILCLLAGFLCLLLAGFLPIALIRFALGGFRAAFQFKDMWQDATQNVRDYAGTYLTYAAVSGILLLTLWIGGAYFVSLPFLFLKILGVPFLLATGPLSLYLALVGAFLFARKYQELIILRMEVP